MSLPARLTRSLAAASLLGTALLGAGTLLPAGAATPPPASALDWLAAEVDANDGLFTYDSGYGEYTDYGLTLDAIMALALGGGHDATVAAARAEVEAGLLSYVTDKDWGDGTGRSAGAIGKTLLAEKISGGNSQVAGFDLEAELRNRIQPASDARRAGRLSDGGAADYSNGFGHALGMLALSRTSAGVPAPVATFLVDQQCANGGFRLYFDIDDDFDGVADPTSTRGCVSVADADADATAIALQALLTVRDRPGIPAVIDRAIAFLGAAALDNSNSLGLAGQGFRAAGRPADADEAANRIAAAQIQSGPDAGAIAYDQATFDEVVGGAIDDADRFQFWRATSEGVLAMGLGPFGPVAQVPDPTTTSTTSSSTTSSSTTSSSTPSSSTPSSTSATTSSTAATGGLPKTGSDPRTQVLMGMLLVGLGLTAAGQGLVRGRRAS